MINILLFLISNLLQPSGVMLRPAVFSLKVYRAEDIPQSEYIRNFIFFFAAFLLCFVCVSSIVNRTTFGKENIA